MSRKQRILVVGAGASGLAAIKACKEEHLEVVCYEKSGDFGGLWRYRDGESDGLASVMKGTVANTSKEMTAFSDFPPPAHFPMYLPHPLMLKYLEMYAEHFDLLTCVNHYQEVTEMYPSEDYGSNGQWIVKVKNIHRDETREEVFDGVMVCCGHHVYPNVPPYAGLDLFSGQVSHSHSYRTFAGFEEKTVLVIGAGNSGTDIAVELSGVCNKVYLSTRRGTWFWPRTFAKGKPVDLMIARRYLALQPASLLENKLESLLNSSLDHERFGIRPYHRVLSQHPTINEDLKSKLISGSVVLKRDVKEFTANGARFDGDEEVKNLDAVIFATGYHIKFPFLNEDIVRVGKNNKVFLYKNVFPPQLKHPSLALVGLVQPSGPLLPVFEMQARWYVSLMTGRSQLPSCDAMLADVRRVEDFRSRNYVQSQRHSVETNYLAYLDELAQQIGCKPNLPAMLVSDPKLFWACFKGPCLPYQFRLLGPHRWEGAKDAILSYKNRLYGSMISTEK